MKNRPCRKPNCRKRMPGELRLLGEVAVPDHDVLREEQVHPEDREREDHLAEVVHARARDLDVPARHRRAQQHADERRRGDRRSRPTGSTSRRCSRTRSASATSPGRTRRGSSRTRRRGPRTERARAGARSESARSTSSPRQFDVQLANIPFAASRASRRAPSAGRNEMRRKMSVRTAPTTRMKVRPEHAGEGASLLARRRTVQPVGVDVLARRARRRRRTAGRRSAPRPRGPRRRAGSGHQRADDDERRGERQARLRDDGEVDEVDVEGAPRDCGITRVRARRRWPRPPSARGRWRRARRAARADSPRRRAVDALTGRLPSGSFR